MWADWQLMQLKWKYQSPCPKPIIGKYQYIIRSPKGTISIVELPNYFRDGVTLWEAYCIEGDHFTDVLRYNSYTEAEIDARRYLEVRE